MGGLSVGDLACNEWQHGLYKLRWLSGQPLAKQRRGLTIFQRTHARPSVSFTHAPNPLPKPSTQAPDPPTMNPTLYPYAQPTLYPYTQTFNQAPNLLPTHPTLNPYTQPFAQTPYPLFKHPTL